MCIGGLEEVLWFGIDGDGDSGQPRHVGKQSKTASSGQFVESVSCRSKRKRMRL